MSKLNLKLCINVLMSSSELKTFVKTNKLIKKLLEIGTQKLMKDNTHEKDIAVLVFTLF